MWWCVMSNRERIAQLNSQSFKVGDSIEYDNANNSTEFELENKSEKRLSASERAMIKWDMADTMSDLSKLSQLEGRLSKTQFRVLIVASGNDGTSLWRMAKREGFINTMIVNSSDEAINILKKTHTHFDLILSSYRFCCSKNGGFEIYKTVRQQQRKSDCSTHFFMIDKYTGYERDNLKKANIPTMSCVRNSIGKDEYELSISRLIKMHYVFYLLETLFGKKDIQEYKEMWAKNPDIVFLESLLNKKQFPILIVDDEPEVLDLISIFAAEIGFDNQYLTSTVSESIEVLDLHNIRLVLSDYRLEPNRNGDKIHKYIRDNGKEGDVSFVMVTGNMDNTVKQHLSDEGIIVIDKISQDSPLDELIKLVIKSYYVISIRERLKKAFKIEE